MADPSAQEDNPILRHARDQQIDRYGARLVQASNKYADKLQPSKKQDTDESKKSSKGPPGGYDATPVPDAPPGYTIKITFHRASNLPYADFGNFSADPYLIAVLKTSLAKRHKEDPYLKIRTPTVHRNTNPEWNAEWIVANVPASGFYLKCRLYDEDPADHDDRLGNVHINVGRISDEYKGFKEQEYELKKRVGSKRAYTFRGCAALFSKSVKFSGSMVVSVENLGRTQDSNGGRSYTVGPLAWSQHYSPLIGRLTGIKEHDESKDGKPGVERYNFQAIQMQLPGPVPTELYHRYVEFKPFVAGMFTDRSLRGRVLNRALHHQHARIYNYDKSTHYGVFEKPGEEMTKKFLEFVHWDQGGRIFTYVITLDAHMRFTETGKEFGIDLLSKHTMHSDVSIYIAFSGEFFIRRLKHPHLPDHASRKSTSGKSQSQSETSAHTDDILPPDEEDADQHRSEKDNVKYHDPKYYELVIDNDSGTYRPNAKLLPKLKDFLEASFPGLRVVTLDCQKDEEKMNKLKEQQRDRKKHSGAQITYLQNNSVSSLSSSDEDELNDRAEGNVHEKRYKKEYHKFMDGGVDTHHGNGDATMPVNGTADAQPPQAEVLPAAAGQVGGDDDPNLPKPWTTGPKHHVVDGVVGRHAQKTHKAKGEERLEALDDHYEQRATERDGGDVNEKAA
jgi:hypothetical protein